MTQTSSLSADRTLQRQPSPSTEGLSKKQRQFRKQQLLRRQRQTLQPKPALRSSHSGSIQVVKDNVRALQTSIKLPFWLKTLLEIQQGAGVALIVVGAITLISYGMLVYIQQEWAKAYQNLEALQQQKWQLASTYEMLKQNLAEQAEHSQLVPPNSETVLIVEPAPIRPAPEITAQSDGISFTYPMGY